MTNAGHRFSEACRWLKRASAGYLFVVMAFVLRIPISLRCRLARALSFRIPAVVKMFEAVPEAQLGRTALFLSLQPLSRETRLAAAARLAGWNTLLVHIGELKSAPGESFSAHARVGGLFQLVLASWLFRGALIHVFGPDGAQAFLLVATKTRPAILDYYDTCSGFTSSPSVWRWCEREAMRLADGITHRDLRGKYLQKRHGYRLPRHNILVYDPLLEDRPRPRQSRNDGQIRVVSVGWTGRGDNSILRIVRAFCASRIHVHIYVNPLQRHADSEMDEYRRLQQQTEYFHFEKPVYGAAYWEQLGRFDFGLAAFEPLIFGEEPVSYTRDYVLGCGSSRIMDYIQTGLGVIVSPGTKFQLFLSRRYATAVVPATRKFFENPRPILEAALRAKALAKSKDLSTISTRGVASRLGQFYARVAGEASGCWPVAIMNLETGFR